MIVITVEGGLVQSISSDDPALVGKEVAVINYDAEAHRMACLENTLLEIALRELISDAVRINRKLAEIEGCLQ